MAYKYSESIIMWSKSVKMPLEKLDITHGFIQRCTDYQFYIHFHVFLVETMTHPLGFYRTK